MVKNLEPEMAYNIIVNDFNRAWDSLVAKETGTVHQGTMFLTFMAYVTLAGASGKRRRRKRSFHLSCRVAKNRDISMLVCPYVLIDDIDEAVKTADLFNRNLTIDDHMEIKRSNIDLRDIEKILADGGVLLGHSIY
jgi:hypothetical protein